VRSSLLILLPCLLLTGEGPATLTTGIRIDHTGDRVWELTEPAIYYQAAYLQLASRFVTAVRGDADGTSVVSQMT